MTTWIRRLRGALGMGLLWALAWGFVGGLIELTWNIWPGFPLGPLMDMWIQGLAIPGFIGGVQFALILGMPVPGYVAPEDGPTNDAARDAMSQLSQLFIKAAELGTLSEPLVTDVSDAMSACADEKHPELDGIVPPASFQAMIVAWATLHGATCLDAYGQFDWMGDAAREQLFEAILRSAALAAGFPFE